MSYEPDDGPLTDEQMASIRELSPDMPDSAMTQNLFDIVIDAGVPPDTIVLVQPGHEDKAVICRMNNTKEK